MRTQQGRLAAISAALPAGTIPVGIGLVVNGISTYGFQILAFRGLGAEPYAALNGLWVTAFILAPGLFLPLEQEIARAIAHRRVRGEGSRPLIGKALMLGATLTIGVVIVLVALRTPIEDRLLRGSHGLFVALIAVLVGWACMSIARGVLSGSGRFGRYGIVVGLDGFVRVFLAVGLAFLGYETLGWYGVVFAIAPYLAVVVGLTGVRGLAEPGPEASFAELSTAIGWLLLGSTFAQALGYSAYVGASLLAGPSQDAELGAFVAAIFIARVPILLFQAVQAALLPRLAGLLASGRVAEFRAGFGRLLMLVVALSIVGVLLAATIGPFLGGKLFGDKFTGDAAMLTMLTAGSCLVVIGLTLAQALIALRRYAIAATAWVAGFAVFLAVLLPTNGDVFTRAEVAFVAGGACAVVILSVVTWRTIRSIRPVSVSSGSAMGGMA